MCSFFSVRKRVVGSRAENRANRTAITISRRREATTQVMRFHVTLVGTHCDRYSETKQVVSYTISRRRPAVGAELVEWPVEIDSIE